MNCFQICIFVLIATTLEAEIMAAPLLWIAFKFVSLYWSQQLLLIYSVLIQVVNCFQICIFVLIATTCEKRLQDVIELWIAFKFVSLYWSQQRTWCTGAPRWRCELLSNLYLCTDRNNANSLGTKHQQVVNCFQICIFVLIATTRPYAYAITIPLWIAFKFVSLYWSQQLTLMYP